VNRYEELLVKASACLTDVSKITDPDVRAKVLELVYQSQLVAQAGILSEIDRGRLSQDSSSSMEQANRTEATTSVPPRQ
jgi:hypothetical protein